MLTGNRIYGLGDNSLAAPHSKLMTFHYVDSIAAEVAGQAWAKLYVANQI